MKRNVLAALGILSAAVPLAAILASISMSPWFTWTGSFLSNLGEEGFPALVFNAGLIAGGLMGTTFAFCLLKEKFYESTWGLRLFMLATISLIFVGVFPVQTDTPHTAASVAFFLLSTASLLTMGFTERKGGKMGWFFLALGIISLTALPLYAVPRPWGFNATVEMVTSLGMSVFTAATAVMILRKSPAAGKKAKSG
ncbi:MAG: DUF998 domain-containing protein [Candidatus Aenigmatarchaeota archaeon]